jgi:hypothetical protein
MVDALCPYTVPATKAKKIAKKYGFAHVHTPYGLFWIV